MRSSIHLRLLFNNLILLLLAMGLAGGLVWLAVEELYIATQRENLLAQARLIATVISGEPISLESTQPYTQTTNTLPGIHTRLLSEGGAVIVAIPVTEPGSYIPVPAAEQSSPVEPDTLLERPEIQSALEGSPATAVRRVASAGNQRVLYAASPVYSQDGDLNGVVYLATPLPATGLPGTLVMQLIGTILVSILLASLAGMRLARQIATPLQDLARSAKVLARGDLQHRAPAQSDIAELHRLGQSFNSMAESLGNADQSQKTFIADVTHELRTPLTVIKGTIETLEDGALDDVSGRTPLLDSMHRETDRLIRLVNDLLVLVRADAGGLKLNLQPLILSELVRTRCEGMSLLANRRQVELSVMDETRNTITLHADSDRISQVLDNLLDNAIRHAPANSKITVRICEAPGNVECAVSDQGPGIPARHLPYIFERFYRIEDARDRNRGGTGLGLAIARALILAHGGHITAANNPGRGSTFTFSIPVPEFASKSPKS